MLLSVVRGVPCPSYQPRYSWLVLNSMLTELNSLLKVNRLTVTSVVSLTRNRLNSTEFWYYVDTSIGEISPWRSSLKLVEVAAATTSIPIILLEMNIHPEASSTGLAASVSIIEHELLIVRVLPRLFQGV